MPLKDSSEPKKGPVIQFHREEIKSKQRREEEVWIYFSFAEGFACLKGF
jgi:hypothetical protein